MYLPRQLPERLVRKIVVQRATGCWLWTGARTGPYGVATWLHPTTLKHVNAMAHRVTYHLLSDSSFPVFIEGALALQIDHLCDSKLCVNPTHLEVVTPQENIRRGRVRRPRPFPPGSKRHRNHPVGRPHNQYTYYQLKCSCDGCLDAARAAAKRRTEAAQRRHQESSRQSAIKNEVEVEP